MSKETKGFVLDTEAGYFRNQGVDVMGFDDFYPEGHQSGVSVLMHGARVATNGDIRFEQTPGQWQPVPKKLNRELSAEDNTIVTELRFPDEDRHLKGFNPMIYPDIELDYKVTMKGEGESILVTVDLDKPLPSAFVGHVCFNLELVPVGLVGKPYLMDGKSGIFPAQPNGPVKVQQSMYDLPVLPKAEDARTDRELLTGGHKDYNPIVADDFVSEPYAYGRHFVLCPDNPLKTLVIESETAEMGLYDGRMNHNNGWFVLSMPLPADTAKGAVVLKLTPHADPDWIYQPVIQHSQVGYHPEQEKVIIVETDPRDTRREDAVLWKLTECGLTEVARSSGKEWGKFLRYQYILFDFSDVREEGLYKVTYCGSESNLFKIAADVYERGVWQPVLEYFLPVQMCHMMVREKYRVWHGRCHMDDANFAPLDYNHVDGYMQPKSSMTKYKAGAHVPGLNKGGWHDAGDYDLRVESQAGESYILSLAYEAFNVNLDVTTIDQDRQITEIHQPDGKNDILQQIEHGLLTVLGAYHALGRLYRGMIANDLRRYVLLGDPTAMTDGIPGNEDDRWVFTEDNPWRELQQAAYLAGSSRAMRGYNDTISADALKAAEELYAVTRVENDFARAMKLQAAVELFLTTGKDEYKNYILGETEFIAANAERVGWIACRVVHAIGDAAFTAAIRKIMEDTKASIDELSAETPYGIPYRPKIWGAGWDIQRLGFQYYFMQKAFPEIFSPKMLLSALNFVLGCHPGTNTSSFASGVGTRSATVAYGINRVDYSYTPGGVISGTALIRPDFPELLEFPFLWQQTEYVLGGGSSNYMFLVLAAREVLGLK